MKRIVIGLVVLAVAFVLGSCDNAGNSEVRSSSDAFGETSILRYVPADTPYVYASLAPVAPDTYAELRPRMDAFLKSIAEVISVAVELDDGPSESVGETVLTAVTDAGTITQDLRDEEDEFKLDEKARRLIDKVQALLSVSALEEIGFDRNTLLVVYGDEFRPVLRIRSDKPERLTAAIVDILADLDVTFETAKAGTQEYSYFSGEAWSLLLADVRGDVVVSAVPVDASDQSIANVLGLSLPETSLADSGRLAEIALDGNYLPYGLGYLDIRRSVAMLLELDPELRVADLSEFLDPSQELSPECTSEFLGLADIAPLYRFGMTELSGQQIKAEYLLQLRPDIAAGLASIVAPVPGLGEDLGGIFFLGYSFDLFAAQQFAMTQLTALETQPFECEHLSLVQDMVQPAKEAVSNNLPPFVSSIKGFSVVLDEIGELNLDDLQMMPFKARMVASLDNPLSLLAMSGMVLPALAAVPLEDNAEPVELPAGTIPQVEEPMFIAVGESAVSLTVGMDNGSAAKQMLAGSLDPVSPLYAYGVDLSTVMSLLAEIGRAKGDELTAEDAAVLKLLDAFTAMDLRYMEALRFADDGIRYDVTVAFD